jgi:cation/acetate symporter
LIETISEQPRESLPEWVDNWEETGLLAWEDKNGDGIVQYVADAEQNEFTVDRDIMVLANPEIAGLPNWVVALIGAGGLAAALSTAAGLLLVISTSVSHDLLKKQIAPNISDKQELMWARIAAIIAVVVAGYFGINPPGFVASVVALSFGLAAASFFPAILLGIFTKKMNKEGAISGMISGLLITIYYIARFKLHWIGDEATSDPDNWWFGISPEGFGTIGMIVNFVIAFTVSKFTPETPQDVQELVETIRIPSGAGEASAH